MVTPSIIIITYEPLVICINASDPIITDFDPINLSIDPIKITVLIKLVAIATSDAMAKLDVMEVMKVW